MRMISNNNNNTDRVTIPLSPITSSSLQLARFPVLPCGSTTKALRKLLWLVDPRHGRVPFAFVAAKGGPPECMLLIGRSVF